MPAPGAGYPFDVPAAGADLLSYAALSYHLPLIVPFSVKARRCACCACCGLPCAAVAVARVFAPCDWRCAS